MRRPRLRQLFRRRNKAAMRGIREDVPIPYDMFDLDQTAREVKVARTLSNIYHKGQRLSWDGKTVLPELLETHGGIQMSPESRTAMQGIMAVILWGELAAWKISADLALRLEPFGARLAATSQTHDEARHFYTMYDYLEELGEVPTQLPPATARMLENVLRAPTLPQRLLGMQLMVEPLALTIFQIVRKRRVEPVLADLLALYERDEARHVALGVLHLPRLIRGMTLDEAARFWVWQMRELWAQFDMLKELLPHFRALGIDPRDVVDVAKRKQLLAIRMMMEELGYDLPVHDLFIRVVNARTAWDYPTDDDADALSRLLAAVEAMWDDVDLTGTKLSHVAA